METNPGPGGLHTTVALSPPDSKTAPQQRSTQLFADPGREFFLVLYALAMNTAKMVSLPFELLLRHRFGERYFSLATFTLSLVAFAVVRGVFVEFTPYLTEPPRSGESILLESFGGIFFLAGAVQYALLARRVSHGSLWHSQYTGEPFPLWQHLYWPFSKQMTEHDIKRFLEPLLIGVLAFILHQVDWVFGRYLTIVSVCLFLRANIDYYLLRTTVLDAIDTRIDAEMLAAVIGLTPHPDDPRGSRISGVLNDVQEREKEAVRVLVGDSQVAEL